MKNIPWKKIFAIILILLMATPVLPSMIAAAFVYPFFDCDAPMHAGNMGNNPANEPICSWWWSTSFSFGILGVLTWPLAMIMTFIYAAYALYKKWGQ